MTQEEAKILAELYSVLAEGKTIQVKTPNDTWKDIKIEALNKIYDCNNYHLKPEPKYRPFKAKEECWQEMQKHHPFGWVIDKYNNFAHIDFVYNCTPENGYGVRLRQNPVNYNFESMFQEYKFADSTPFGITDDK